MTFNEVILILFDLVLAVAALLSAVMTQFSSVELIEKFQGGDSIYSVLIYVLIILFSSHLMEVYDLDKNYRKREIIINILFGAFTAFALLSIVYDLDQFVKIGRDVLLVSILFFAIFQICWHILFLMGKNTKHFSHRIMILGTGMLAGQIGEMIAGSGRNLSLAGYVTCDNGIDKPGNGETAAFSVPQDAIISNTGSLLEKASENKVDMLVVALSEKRGVFPVRDVLKCKLNGIRVVDAPSMYELIFSKLMLEQITPSWFIFSSGFNRSLFFMVVKRILDVLLATFGLLVSLPFFPLIALAIKLDSSGPVFFKQIRVGLKEKSFMLYKFRTMCQDAEQRTGAMWSTKNDSRITKLGRFLRNSRIDEIPQLINVFKGEMSFVGPRPERPEFVQKLNEVIPYYSKRHFIKPGLTGWAQVRYPYGSSVQDAIEKLRYDLYYIKNIAAFLDTLIFLETIKVVLFGRGGR